MNDRHLKGAANGLEPRAAGSTNPPLAVPGLFKKDAVNHLGRSNILSKSLLFNAACKLRFLKYLNSAKHVVRHKSVKELPEASLPVVNV